MTRKKCIDGMQRIIDEDRNKILVGVHVGYLIHAVKYLNDQPEIVRCKDCKHGEQCIPPCEDRYCIVYDQRHNEGWFCADGERQEG